MTSKLIGRWLMALACAVWLWGCSPTAVPLTRKGVAVPSDVKLQPGPKAAMPPGEPPPAIASPGAN